VACNSGAETCLRRAGAGADCVVDAKALVSVSGRFAFVGRDGAAFLGEGDGRNNGGSRAGRIDDHFSLELAQPFAHSANPNPRAARLNFGQFLLRDAAALIAYFDQHALRLAQDLDCRALAAGVAMNVCQALLHEPKDSQFHFAGETAELFRNAKADVQTTAVRQAADVPGKRVFFGNGLSQLQNATSFLNQEQVELSTQENNLVGADMAQVVSNYSQAQVQQQAVLSAAGKILGQPTLFDYLPNA
jgi:hypothetical protein